MKLTKTLDIHTAELTTAAVEVKTLTIRGKQVTLAVFRQLEEKPLLLDDGTLAGVPWGRVNYHPDKCADATVAHMHVVWQQGTELRRARVSMKPWFEPFYGDGLTDYFFLSALRHESWTGSSAFPSWVGWKREYVDNCINYYATFTFDGLACETAEVRTNLTKKGYIDETLVDHTVSYEEVEAEMSAAVEGERQRRRRIAASAVALTELPQLFIAV